MVIKVKGAGSQIQAEKLGERRGTEEAGKSTPPAGSDEQVRKITKQGVEFSSRFVSGGRYLGSVFANPLEDAQADWKAEFKDVIAYILHKNHLDFPGAARFTYEQYMRFLLTHPKERERIKEQVTVMAVSIKDHRPKKPRLT